MKLSILIAAYNVEAFIEKCVKSCFDDDVMDDYEIIVVNDGSTDATTSLVAALLKEIPNLKLIDKKNEGLGAARNTGIENAQGEYIWMIDGDDFIETTQINVIISELVKTNIDVYCMNYNITDKDGVVSSSAHSREKINEVFNATVYYQKFKSNSYTWQYVFKKEIFLKNKLLFKPAINMQDSEILPKILYYTNTVKYIGIVGYNYVQHPNSFTNDSNFKKRLRYFESIVVVDKSLEDFKQKILKDNFALADAIQAKQTSLHQIVFNHLIYFKYSDENLKSILMFLNNNNFYPLQFNPSGKLKIVKFGINTFPQLTKKIIDKVRK